MLSSEAFHGRVKISGLVAVVLKRGVCRIAYPIVQPVFIVIMI